LLWGGQNVPPTFRPHYPLNIATYSYVAAYVVHDREAVARVTRIEYSSAMHKPPSGRKLQRVLRVDIGPDIEAAAD